MGAKEEALGRASAALRSALEQYAAAEAALPQAHAEHSVCGWWAETLRRVAAAPEHAAEAHMAAAHLESEEHRAAHQESLATALYP